MAGVFIKAPGTGRIGVAGGYDMLAADGGVDAASPGPEPRMEETRWSDHQGPAARAVGGAI
jgi:hypothetical protein